MAHNLGLHFILNKNKEVEPCKNILKWTEWWSDISNRIIAKEVVGDEEIILGFSGIDLGHGLEEEPILFEVLVLDKGGYECFLQKEYATLQEATEYFNYLVSNNDMANRLMDIKRIKQGRASAQGRAIDLIRGGVKLMRKIGVSEAIISKIISSNEKTFYPPKCREIFDEINEEPNKEM